MKLKLSKFIKKQGPSAILIALLALLAGGLVAFALILNDLPNPEQFETRQVAQSTKIYDRTGKILLYEIHGEEKRTTIPFAEIPEFVKQATVAIEDSNFYTNPAFDWKAIVRAVLVNLHLREGYAGQGGSTITQQLARNAFLSPERTLIMDLIRKIKELFVAIELEKRYGKDEILGLYLNQIPYGGNTYGIEAAAKTFFNKSAKDLSLAESALLASLPRGTSYYSPWGKHIDELYKRKNQVLEKMEALGYITAKQKEKAKAVKLEFSVQAADFKAPHFVLEVQDYLNKKYGEIYTQTAGLNVITTLDWELQQSAEKAVLEGANRNRELYQGYNAALVAQDATNGQILALAGSKDYFGSPEPENCAPGKNCGFEGNFNVTTQGLRQPGSSIKPFAYLAAFKKGLTPDTMLFDTETEFDATGIPENSYKPGNFDGIFRGPVSMRTALAQSINIPAIKTLYLAGIDNFLALVKDFGITTLTERSRYGLSLVLGGGEITLKELVGAYSVLAQEGVKHQQIMILSVTDSKNNVVEEYRDSATQVIDAQYPRLINNILTDIDERSGLFSSSLGLTIFPGHEVALKTGTTNDYRDAWTMGYTPDLVVGVWTGNNDNTPMQKHGSSILAAVPIWSAFMKDALKNRPLVSFNKPDSIAVSKPMFNKDYIVNYAVGNQNYPQIHNILYYIDKNNPTGPAPTQPENDSQFKNWEDPVLQWAALNVPNFSQLYNRPIPFGAQNTANVISSGAAVITLNNPKNGDFIIKNIQISAEISSPNDLSQLQLIFNNEIMDSRAGLFGKNISYQFNLIPKNTTQQNLLKIRVVDSQNKETIKEVILYK